MLPTLLHIVLTYAVLCWRCREEVGKARLHRIQGLEHQERLDAQLYNDYESQDQRKVGGT